MQNKKQKKNIAKHASSLLVCVVRDLIVFTFRLARIYFIFKNLLYRNFYLPLQKQDPLAANLTLKYVVTIAIMNLI
jgi:hypothetical protein